MITYRIQVLAILALVATLACGQEIPIASAIPFLGLESLAAQMKMDVFAVEVQGNQANTDTTDDWISKGTGFFVSGYKDNLSLTNLNCITCYHVVKAAQDSGKPLFIGVEDTNQYHRVPGRVIYSDLANDIAVLRITFVPADAKKIISHAFLRGEIAQTNNLTEGVGLVIPGYPLGIGTEQNKNHPIVRIGIVAQSPHDGRFLIDGIASHGNSGSPVARVKGGRGQLVGMVSAHLADKISLFDERGQLAAQLPYNSGLAQAVSSTIIQQTLNKLDSIDNPEKANIK